MIHYPHIEINPYGWGNGQHVHLLSYYG